MISVETNVDNLDKIANRATIYKSHDIYPSDMRISYLVGGLSVER